MSNPSPLKRRMLSLEEYENGLLQGDRTVLGRAITLVESSLEKHRRQAHLLMTRILPYTGRSLRVGITGVPGVGKSTFIESLGTYLTGRGLKVAVLAVDPSSSISGGSILGDKTRMARLSTDANAFIRPSPSAGTLGGVASRTRETILLCEAAGFDVVLVETVGVGQSETLVHGMTDCFLALMLPGAGDELQGIKRGLLELIDMLVINKADGNNVLPARRAAREYKNALHFMQSTTPGWRPPVLTCSALHHENVDKVWSQVEAYRDATQASGTFEQKRKGQVRTWMWTLIDEDLRAALRAHRGVAALLPGIEAELQQGHIAPSQAASRIIGMFLGGIASETGD